MSQPTRLSLLEEIRETHSSDRWTEFLDDYGVLLRKWLVTHQVEPEDADDIQQETLLSVWKDLPKFEHSGRPGAFRSWLKQILTNRIRRVWEKKKVRKPHFNLGTLADVLEDEASRLSIEFHKEHDRYLIDQLFRLAETHFPKERLEMFRELVLLGEPVDTVAKKYRMTIGAVRVQQHRILAWLKTFGKGMIDL